MDLSWTSALTGSNSIAGYEIQRSTDGITYSTLTQTAADATTYTDSSVANGTTYYYIIIAYDIASNWGSAWSSPANATPVAAFVPPGQVTDLSAADGQNSKVDLSWGPALAGSNPIGAYVIYRSDGGSYYEIGRTSGSATTYTDDSAVNGNTYSYSIIAYDDPGVGNVSSWGAWSNVAVATPVAPADATPPTVPDGLAVSSVDDGAVSLSWNVSTDSGSGMGTYQIWASTTGASGTYAQLTTSDGNSKTVTGLSNDQAYWFQVVAVDNASNSSAMSSSALGIPIAPAATGTVHEFTDLSARGFVTAVWLSGSTPSGMPVYYYYQRLNSDGSWTTATQVSGDGTALHTAVTGLSAGDTYVFRVRTSNSVSGPYSSWRYVTTSTVQADTQAPTAPSSFTALPSPTSNTGVSVTYGGASDDVGIYSYRVTKDSGVTSFTVSALLYPSSYSGVGYIAGTTYNVQIRSVDQVGNMSAWSDPVTVTTGPKTPGTPTFAGITSSSMSVAFAASTSPLGIDHYEIQRNTTASPTNATTFTSPISPFPSTGLNTKIKYYYRVRAFDSAGISGNWSSWGNATTL